jgi:hypothetical protein
VKARMIITNRPGGRCDLDHVVQGTVDGIQDTASKWAHLERGARVELLDVDTGDRLAWAQVIPCPSCGKDMDGGSCFDCTGWGGVS